MELKAVINYTHKEWKALTDKEKGEAIYYTDKNNLSVLYDEDLDTSKVKKEDDDD